MLDFTRPNPYADLGANLTRIYANAALSAFVAAASQGLMLWSGLISASLPRSPGDAAALPPLLRPLNESLLPDWRQFAYTYPWLPAVPTRDQRAAERIVEPKKIEAKSPSFSAYRSDGGHAVAQVVMA